MKKMNNAMRGFTLIEMMVVMLIVGILFTVALPSYSSYMRQTYRSLATLELTALRQAMENYYIENLSFDGVADDINYNLEPSSLTGRYTLEISGVSGRAYTLTATKSGNEPQSLDKCGNLTLNELGERGVEGADSDYTVETCW